MILFLSYVLIAAFLLGPIAVAGTLAVKKQRNLRNWIVLFLVTTVACYLCVVLSVALTEVHLDRELASYDLDRNGEFTGSEITPGMQAAMDRVARDTGRTFAPITAAVVSPIYCGAWFLIVGTFLVIRRAWNRRRKA